GYGKNGEFEGTDWELHVAQIAQQVGALKNVKAVSLKTAATRELVAELLFQVAAYVNTVTYTSAFGYVGVTLDNIRGALTDGGYDKVLNNTLGWKNFNLAKDADYGDDDWGRPAYVWYADKNDNESYDEDTKDVLYATIADKPAMSFTVATKQCDILKKLGEKNELKIEDTYVNGDGTVADAEIEDTTTTFGAQGQLVEIFDMGDDGYRVVVIDTYLAKVTDVDKLEKDKNDHVETPASITVTPWGADEFTLESDEANFKYAKGDIVLVNVNDTDTKSVILGKAESKDAKQTYIYLNADKHEIGDKTYFDAVNFEKDDAGLDDEAKYTWYFDQYGNVIGAIEIVEPTTYGIITEIEWKDNVKSDDKVIADLMFMDGSKKNDVVIKEIDNIDLGDISYNKKENTDLVALNLYAVSVNDKDEYTLEIVENVDVNASIETGVSKIADGVYADNDTMFLIRSGEEGKYTYKTVTGYEKIADYSDCEIDYVLDSDEDYAEFVFVKGDADEEHKETENFLFFTNKEAKLTLKSKDNKVDGDVVSTTWTITFTGAIDMNGKTDAVTAKLTIPAEDNVTKEALTNMIKYFLEASQGMMFKANMVDGAVAFDLDDGTFGLEPVDDAEYCGGLVAEVNDKDYVAYGVSTEDASIGAGVLKVYNVNGELVALNINSNTTYATEDGKGKATDLTSKMLEKYDYAYVIASKKTPTTAVAIFLTNAEIAECEHDTFYVYVNDVQVKADAAVGDEIIVYDWYYDDGTGYVAGEDSYFPYGTNYVVNADDAYSGVIDIYTEYYLLTVDDDDPVAKSCNSDINFAAFASAGTYVDVNGTKVAASSAYDYDNMVGATWVTNGDDVTITTGFVKVTVYNYEEDTTVSSLGTGDETYVAVGEAAFEYTNSTNHHVCVFSAVGHHTSSTPNYYYGSTLVQTIEMGGDLTAANVTTGTSNVTYYIFAERVLY
ncbi:MAG: hypothetical protein Q3995_03665, partial [Eubacteriales bacterium]|nr:hypothetical protein [Eubacteriales bacterium]